MTQAAPTILAVEADSAWVVILAVSLVTFPVALLFRRVIKRPGGFASGLLMVLPLLLPLVTAIVFQRAVLPEFGILRPVGPDLLHDPAEKLLHFLVVADARDRLVIPYALSGSAGTWILVIGFAASSLMLLRRSLGYLAMRRLIRRCSRPEDGALSRVEAAVRRLACAVNLPRAPEVLFLPVGIPGAFATARGGGKIMLARDLVASLDDRELEAIVAHEIAHLEARDGRLIAVAGILRDMVVWNPIAHFALRRLEIDREFEADRRAADMTGKPLAVASSLLKMCEMMNGHRRARRAALAFWRPDGRLRRRVTRMLALADGPLPTIPTRCIPFVAAACLTAALGMQVGAGIARQSGSAFAIVWGAPDVGSMAVWNEQQFLQEAKLERTAAQAKKAAKGKGKRAASVTATRVSATDGIALRHDDLPRWLRTLSKLPDSEGISMRMLPWEKGQGWRAVPVFTGGSLGPFGIYRVDSQPLPRPLGGRGCPGARGSGDCPGFQ
ncbi:MAG: M48 family metalloprotease [Actinomycetota bacterium]